MRIADVAAHRYRIACQTGVVDVQKKSKTYNSGDSLVVTHLTTNPPVHCLYMAERTGSLIFSVLWSYVKEMVDVQIDEADNSNGDSALVRRSKFAANRHCIAY